MRSKPRPYLKLVWPPLASDEDPGDFLCMQERALKSDGWRSVSLDDLRMLPPDTSAVLTTVKDDQGRIKSFWIKNAPKTWAFSMQ